jgi:hypothetical protein
VHKVSEQEGKFVGISAGADRVRGAADPGNHQTPTRTKGVARKGIVKRGATHENISISKWKVEMSQHLLRRSHIPLKLEKHPFGRSCILSPPYPTFFRSDESTHCTSSLLIVHAYT